MNNVQHRNIPMEYQHTPFEWVVQNGAERRLIIPHMEGLLLYQISTREIYVSIFGEFRVVGTGYPREDGEMYLQRNGEWVRLKDYLYANRLPDKTNCNISGESLKEVYLFTQNSHRMPYRQSANISINLQSQLPCRNHSDIIIYDITISNNDITVGNVLLEDNTFYINNSVRGYMHSAYKFYFNYKSVDLNNHIQKIVNDSGFPIIIHIESNDIILQHREVLLYVLRNNNEYIELGKRTLPDYWRLNNGINYNTNTTI